MRLEVTTMRVKAKVKAGARSYNPYPVVFVA